MLYGDNIIDFCRQNTNQLVIAFVNTYRRCKSLLRKFYMIVTPTTYLVNDTAGSNIIIKFYWFYISSKFLIID